MEKNKGVTEARQVTKAQVNEIKQKLINEDKDNLNLKEGAEKEKFQKKTTKTQSIDLADPQTNNPIIAMESSTCSCNPMRIETNLKRANEERGLSVNKEIVRRSFQRYHRIDSVDKGIGNIGLVNGKLQKEIPKRFGRQNVNKDYIRFPYISIKDHLTYNNSTKKQHFITVNSSLKEPIINTALRYDQSKRYW